MSDGSLLSHFPYPEARDVQEEILREIEAHWETHDVFVVVAPTATGKSALARAIQTWTEAASLVVPTNVLVEQFLEEFPDAHTLRRADLYTCDGGGGRVQDPPYPGEPCSRTKDRTGGYCRGCACGSDLARALWRGQSGVYTYHTYLARRIYRPTLVVDEAHNLIPFLTERFTKRIWYKRIGLPERVQDAEALLAWIDSLPKKKREGVTITELRRLLTSESPDYYIDFGEDEWLGGGEGEARGTAVLLPCLRLRPIQLHDLKPVLYPKHEVKKLILLSATFSVVDIRRLGLDRRRVRYLEAASPIPVEARPIVFHPIATLTLHTIVPGTRRIGDWIRDTLLPHHEGEKGLLHVTYEQAQILAEYLGDCGGRLLYHNREDKQEVYEFFRASPPEDGLVLVASGMYEGVDLPHDAGRFQVLAKIPWPSLGDPAIRVQAEADEAWYTWETLRTVIQACGRISRTPTDYGVTYVVDSTFRRLYDDSHRYGLVPRWWNDALIRPEQ